VLQAANSVIAGNRPSDTNTVKEEGVLEKIIMLERFLEMAPSSLSSNGSIVELLIGIKHMTLVYAH
jgi:hypothetical protein